MVFVAADGYFEGCLNVHEIGTVVVDVVSFFLGFVALDYDRFVVAFVLAPSGAGPDGVVDAEAHDGTGCEMRKKTTALVLGMSGEVGRPFRWVSVGKVCSNERTISMNLCG